MKAISLKQPYASLMLFNKIETRTWPTSVRERILICASKKHYNIKTVVEISGEKQLERICNKLNTRDFKSLPQGIAIAVGGLTGCRQMTRKDEDKAFVQYYPDLQCHFYSKVRPAVGIPVTGFLGFFNVPGFCMHCGCHEMMACNDLQNDTPCRWADVDVCSCCEPRMKEKVLRPWWDEWNAREREKSIEIPGHLAAFPEVL